MNGHPTVRDVLDHAREYRRGRRCPDCTALVSIRGIHGDHWWTCMECDAVGLGYATRGAILDDLRPDET